MTVTIYGIKNCDTMKKAFKWLEGNSIEFIFHDYKKSGINEDNLRTWLEQKPWDELINRRGTTWRKLSDEDKEGIDNTKAVSLMMENTSLIKRPVLEIDGAIHLGFKDTTYEELFK